MLHYQSLSKNRFNSKPISQSSGTQYATLPTPKIYQVKNFLPHFTPPPALPFKPSTMTPDDLSSHHIKYSLHAAWPNKSLSTVQHREPTLEKALPRTTSSSVIVGSFPTARRSLQEHKLNINTVKAYQTQVYNKNIVTYRPSRVVPKSVTESTYEENKKTSNEHQRLYSQFHTLSYSQPQIRNIRPNEDQGKFASRGQLIIQPDISYHRPQSNVILEKLKSHILNRKNTLNNASDIFKKTDMDSETFSNIGIGYTCKKGFKMRAPNQDDFFIVRFADLGLYGVFDGHGPYGHNISRYVRSEILKYLTYHIKKTSNYSGVLKDAFTLIDQSLDTYSHAHPEYDPSSSGTTATVIIHLPLLHKLYIAHVGDSRCVLCRYNREKKKFEAINLTEDHRPNNQNELQRIYKSGGLVRKLNGDLVYRVFLKGSLYPGLAMSRSIGDTIAQTVGIICEPEIYEHSIDIKNDLFLCLCSDGVWEFFSSDEAGEFIIAFKPENVQLAAEALANESWNRWVKYEIETVDDITTQIIYLNPTQLK